jgi:hypothetical protein
MYSGPLFEKSFKVEPPGHHREAAIVIARPFGLGSVAVEFNAILVGIAQIERFAYPVIGGAVEPYAIGGETAERIGKIATARIEDCDVIKAGGAGWRRRAALAFPGVEPDVVMIAASLP